MNKQEINARFETIERRLDIIEGKNKGLVKVGNNLKEDFSGLAGGIRLLIKNGFLKSPKDTKEIKTELKRESYHYTDAGISSTLTETFVKNKRVLNRIKENKKWKYVIRK